MTGLLMLARLTQALLPGFQCYPSGIFFAGDSECTISCMEADDRILATWFTNRVAAVKDLMDSWSRDGILVHELHHWPGEDNVEDIATKGAASLSDVIEGSPWQNGPKATSFPISEWPASRDFTRRVPQEEMRSPVLEVHAIRMEATIPKFKHGGIAHMIDAARSLMKRSNRLTIVTSALARLMKSQYIPGLDTDQSIKTVLATHPTAMQLERAERFLFVVASLDVEPFVKQWKRLDPVWEDFVLVCRGRLGATGMALLTGQASLPILP